MTAQSTSLTPALRKAPGPRGVPFLGSLPGAWRDPLDLFTGAWREHGDIVRFPMGPFEYLLVNDVDAIHRLLVENHRNYPKSRNYRSLKLVLGEGLVTSEGEFWRRQRKLAQPAFHREKLAGFVETMAADTARMLDRWDAEQIESLDAHEEMMRLTFRIVGRTLFSTDLDGEARAVGDAVKVALVTVNDFAAALVNVPLWVPTPQNVRFKRALRTLDAVVLRIIEERRAGKARANDVLDMLMSAKDEETREQMTDRQLRDEVMTLVLAGHETTANALSWSLYLLSLHPDVDRRLAREVAEVLGDRRPTIDDLPRLKLTAAVVQESMRLFPPVWAFERQAVGSDQLGGYHVAPRTIIAVSPYVLHRHPRHWDNPEGFDPDRFLAPDVKRHKFAYLPFGGGPRQCIGNGFAMMEAQIVLAMIVQACRLELAAGHVVVPDPNVTMRPKRGVPMLRKRRGSAVAAPNVRAIRGASRSDSAAAR